jgi:hypothetical protein
MKQQCIYYGDAKHQIENQIKDLVDVQSLYISRTEIFSQGICIYIYLINENCVLEVLGFTLPRKIDEACHFLCSFRADDEDSLISTERNR